MPKFTRQSFFKLSEKCEQFLTGKWLGKHTTVETRYIERPDGTKLRVLICKSKAGTKPNATGLLWIHGGGYAIGAPEQDFFFADPLTRDGSCVAVMPACTYVGTIEPFHDETVDFVNRLREQGVEVTFKEYEGCFHAFDMMGAGTKVVKDARVFLLENFRNAQKQYYAD